MTVGFVDKDVVRKEDKVLEDATSPHRPRTKKKKKTRGRTSETRLWRRGLKMRWPMGRATVRAATARL